MQALLSWERAACSFLRRCRRLAALDSPEVCETLVKRDEATEAVSAGDMGRLPAPPRTTVVAAVPTPP